MTWVLQAVSQILSAFIGDGAVSAAALQETALAVWQAGVGDLGYMFLPV